jgi:ribokinase
MAGKKICVMGSFVVDLTSRAPHLPVKGETVMGSMFKLGPGGKGANQGVAAKRAGGDVTMVTKVGRDVFGDVAMNNFKKEGIYSKYIFEDDKLETGTALIMVDDEGSNSILVVPGACANITQEEIESCRPLLQEAAIMLTQLEVNMDATERMVALAHELGVLVILNTAPVQPVKDEMLAKVDIVTPNEVEAGILTGIAVTDIDSAREAAKSFFAKGVKRVVITLGEKGVYCNDGQREALIPVLPVSVVDTTGAGDAFSGAFATALAEGKGFFEAAVFGNVAAGLAVSRFGTAVAMAQRAEIDAALVQHAALFGASLR